MKNKKVVAIVVTYNRYELLLESVHSLLKNGECDIFIIDNSSTDGTEQKIRSFVDNKKVWYFNTGKNIGGAGGFNFGMRKAYDAGYDYIWLMDDDTIVHRDSLQKLIEQAQNIDNNFGWLSSMALWVDGNVCHMNYQEVDNEWNKEKKDILNGRLLCQAATFVSLLINREAVEKVDLPIKDYFIWGDDTEYTKRISKSFPCYFVPQSQVTHKMKSNNGTTNFEDYEDEERIDRMFYSIRNDLCTYRRLNKRRYCVFILQLIQLIGKVIKSNKPYKIKKLKIIVKGLWKGLWFHPQIETVK